MPPPDQLLQKHFANLGHVRNVFQIDPRVQAGPAQVAPWLSRVVQLVHPAFPGSFQFNDPEVRSFANPAVATDFSITVPPNEAWGLRAVHCLFVTDANAANRAVHLILDDSVNNFFHVAAPGTQPATFTARFAWGRSFGYEKAQNTYRSMGLPDVILDTGWTVRTAVDSMQAGDQFSQVAILIDVFPR